MGALRAFFGRHPMVHAWTNRILYAVAGLLIMKDELLELVGYIPEGTLAPKILGWVLAGAAFSRLLLRGVGPGSLTPGSLTPGSLTPGTQPTQVDVPDSKVVVGTEDPNPPA